MSRWLAYPFRPTKARPLITRRHFPPVRHEPGTIFVEKYSYGDDSWETTFYRPTAADLDVLMRHYPDADPDYPPWVAIQVALVEAGHSADALRDLMAPVALRLLAPAGPPATHVYGPLQGTKKHLSACLDGPDARTLDRKDQSGEVWMKKLARYSYEVWFRSQAEYAAANSRMLTLKDGVDRGNNL